MSKAQEKLKKLFEKYGKIKSIGEDSEKYEFYKFTCNNKNLYDKDDIFYTFPDIDFALACGTNDECILFYFRAGTNDIHDKKIYQIINQVNKKVEYGKYTLDSDGDIDWEYRFDITYTNSDDIKSALLSFYEGMMLFVLLKKEGTI